MKKILILSMTVTLMTLSIMNIGASGIQAAEVCVASDLKCNNVLNQLSEGFELNDCQNNVCVIKSGCGNINKDNINKLKDIISNGCLNITPDDNIIAPDINDDTNSDDNSNDIDNSIENDDSNENSSINEFEIKVLNLVNEERAKYGLNALEWNDNLADVARAHSKDMSDRNFFSHTNPDGKSPFDRMNDNQISYNTAAENIAYGQSTPEDVMNSWMNSEGHRSNILNANMKYLGVGYYLNSNNTAYWTQCFIG